MREIKFRCWFADQMWYGIPAIHFIDDGVVYVSLNQEDDDFDSVPDTWTGTDDYVLMQFTGLYDKNGREIYEGDICRTHDWHENEDGRKTLSNANKYYYNVVIEYRAKTPFCGYAIHDWYEVVGNIHENPELLE